MRFVAEHRFEAAPAAVVDQLVDPDFHLGLALPDVSVPELLERGQQGGIEVLRLRYEYTGQLDARARRLLGGHVLRWVQELRVDRAAGGGTLHMAADAMPSGLHARADFTIRPWPDVDGVGAGRSGPGRSGSACSPGSVRWLHGDLVVGVPVIGPMAERRIVPGLLARLDVEAAALDAAASGPPGRRRRS